nr:hypothetical protein Ccrd_025604 [Ipomoea trifida]
MFDPKPPFSFDCIKGQKFSTLILCLTYKHLFIPLNYWPISEVAPGLLVKTFYVEECNLSRFVETLSNRWFFALIHVHCYLPIVELNNGLQIKPSHICFPNEFYATKAMPSHNEIFHTTAKPSASMSAPCSYTIAASPARWPVRVMEEPPFCPELPSWTTVVFWFSLRATELGYFVGDGFSILALEGHCSNGRIIRALGFSLGTKKASAFGVLVVSSSSKENCLCDQLTSEALQAKFQKDYSEELVVKPMSFGWLTCPKADELDCPKREGVVFAANVEALEPNKEGVVNDVDPNRFDVVEAPKAEELNAGVLETPNPGLPNAEPNAGVVVAPNAGVLVAPKAGVVEVPNAGVVEPKTGELETPNGLPVLPKVGLAVVPKAGVLETPNAGVLVAPKAGVEIAERSLQKDLIGECLIQMHQKQIQYDVKKHTQVKGVDEAPNVGVVLPKAGEDAPKTGVEPKGEEDWVAPKTPVDVPPKIEVPV